MTLWMSKVKSLHFCVSVFLTLTVLPLWHMSHSAPAVGGAPQAAAATPETVRLLSTNAGRYVVIDNTTGEVTATGMSTDPRNVFEQIFSPDNSEMFELKSVVYPHLFLAFDSDGRLTLFNSSTADTGSGTSPLNDNQLVTKFTQEVVTHPYHMTRLKATVGENTCYIAFEFSGRPSTNVCHSQQLEPEITDIKFYVNTYIHIVQ